MSVRLTVTQRSQAGSAAKPAEFILDDEVITLGRDKSCQVVLVQQAVSRNHARISQEGTLFFLEDLGSAYGTQVNGKPLPKGEKRLLRNGDVIAIAQYDVRFDRVADLPRDVNSEKTSFVARSMVKDVMRGLASGEGPYFRIMNGPREGERIEISDAQELIIGRDESADIVFKDDLVSRRHVKIRRDWSGTHVEDLGSRNGIKVNKKKLIRQTLKDSDELEVGGVRLLYVDPTEVPEQAVVLPEVPEDLGDDGEGNQHTPVPRERPSPARRAAKPASEAEAAKQEESSAAGPVPPPDPVAAEPPPTPQPPPVPASPPPPVEEPPISESIDLPPGKLLRQKLVPLVLMGVFGLIALGIIIAVLAGV